MRDASERRARYARSVDVGLDIFVDFRDPCVGTCGVGVCGKVIN